MIVHSRDGLAGARLIALTFDDGPGSLTPELLELLGDHGARATFFVLGRWIDGRDDTLRRMVAEGHEIGNHAFSHTHPARLTDQELRNELAWTSELVEAATDLRPVLARPPYGGDPERFARIAAEFALAPTVLWSIDPVDWSDDEVARIVERILRGLAPGAIVDLHDGAPAHRDDAHARSTIEAVADLLPRLAADGYTCVTVSELLSPRPAA